MEQDNKPLLGRKPRAIPRRSRHLYIREDIAATVDLILLDPLREKVKYGKWSDLVETLLRNWIAEQRTGRQAAIVPQVDRSKVQLALAMLDKAPPTEQPDMTWAAVTEARRLLKEALT